MEMVGQCLSDEHLFMAELLQTKAVVPLTFSNIRWECVISFNAHEATMATVRNLSNLNCRMAALSRTPTIHTHLTNTAARAVYHGQSVYLYAVP